MENKDLIDVEAWRHEATVYNNGSLHYRVHSQNNDYTTYSSNNYKISFLPLKNQPLKILLTSDHQNKKGVPIGLESAAKIVNRFDAVFYAGDLANWLDGFNEWFGKPMGFFSCLQKENILQTSPIYPCIGNHDLNVEMKSLKYENKFLVDFDFQYHTFNQLFSIPVERSHPPYYAITFGNIRLVCLVLTKVWGYPFSCESILPGSRQYEWLLSELNSDEFKNAELRIVMLHEPIHSVGAFRGGTWLDIKENYPDKISYHEDDVDVLVNILEPLLDQYGTDLVMYGHCHVWNRFINKNGMHMLETARIGSSHPIRKGNTANGGLSPVMPSIAPLKLKGINIPFIPGGKTSPASAFSILDTEKRTIDSYYIKGSEIIKFDSFCPYRRVMQKHHTK